ncbi:MAG: ABC transporter ATP-binding protein [Firmicutes bacterium]|nr:ABC transporter ATP-binding protein [Bacillota bacterium]
MYAIELWNLRKEYRNGRGIHGLSLQVEQGEIFGFLGPNGAGKSTTIRTLLGLLTPDGGRAQVAGWDILRDSVAVRRVTGYLPSENALYTDLSGAENLRFALQVRGVSGTGRARELAERLGADLRPRLRNLSHGQRQKVAIVVALAHDPQVLILDEPTTGLDPLVQETFFSLLREEQARGKTIFISSHVLSEVEALCGRVAIIRDGVLVEVNQVEALRHSRVKRLDVAFVGTPPNVAAWPGVRKVCQDGQRVRFAYHGQILPLLRLLAAEEITDLTVNDPSLEEVFRAFYQNGPVRDGASGRAGLQSGSHKGGR